MTPHALAPTDLTIHVIHYTPFVERRVHMEKTLQETGLAEFPVRWITKWDREEILRDYEQGGWGDPGKIAAASVSLILKHLEAYRKAASEPDKWHLILEDDILIRPDFWNKLNRCLSELPADWELFFIGAGCDLHIPWWRRRPGKRVYLRGHKPWKWHSGGTSRCTEAYFIKPAFARRLLDTAHCQPPFRRPIDWLLAEAGYELHPRSYWAEPPLITQGAFESWTKDPGLNGRSPAGRTQ